MTVPLTLTAVPPKASGDVSGFHCSLVYSLGAEGGKALTMECCREDTCSCKNRRWS